MSLYFDSPVQFPDTGVISTQGAWHPSAPLLAVGSYSQERGGFVTIFDEMGEPLRDITFPVHPVSQVTALAWHPDRNILACCWESGEVRIWNGTDKEFTNVNGPHTAPVNFLAFSEKGGRLVTADASGSLVGWKVDSRGQAVTAFHHDLKDSVTHLTFRLSIRNTGLDIEGLAKAAVNGDENALDLFSDWRPRTTARQFKIHDGSDNHCFFVGTQSGVIYYINQAGECVEVLNTEASPLAYMLYHPSRDSLVIMREGFNVEHFAVNSQGQLTELARVKLSGKAQALRSANNQGLVWAGNSSLAILTGELTVRIWDVDTNDNYVLPIYLKSFMNEDRSKQFNEMFMCISYSKINQTLCAGTNLGQIYFWIKKQTKTDYIDNPEETWTLTNINSVNGTIKQLMWGSVNLRLPLIAVNCITKVYILKEQSLSTCYSENIWATQKTASQILLETTFSNFLLKTDIQVTCMSMNNEYIAVTNSRNIYVYSIQVKNLDNMQQDGKKKTSSISTTVISSSSCDNEKIIMYGKNVIVLTKAGVLVRSPNGLNIATIPSTSSEGDAIGISVTNNFLTIFTMDGYIKLYDLIPREPKLVAPVRSLYDMCSDFGEIIHAKSNSTGNKIALTLATSNLIPDGKLYVWDVETDNLMDYNFRNRSDYDDVVENENEEAETPDKLNDFKSDYDKICLDRIPLSLCWDTEDARLLICDAKKLKSGSQSVLGTAPLGRQRSAKRNLENCDHIIITMFVSSEHGIRIQDIRPADDNSKLLAVCTPYIVTLEKLTIVRHVMNDFSGLENCDKSTREAVLDFSFHLSLGNMDAAFKAIKLVQSTGVWNSLARMCVKTRRLDVASVCFGHMKNARAASALRKAMADNTIPQEAKVAVLAIQLGLLDEAELLYIACERYDLLNKLNQARNKMEAAVAIAESRDRIHLRSTEYEWGKTLEESGDFVEAISKYEHANTHRYNVPRMLIDHPKQLEAYIAKSNDPELLKWWGQYVESQGDMTSALKYYEQAGDLYSQVRVLCFMGDQEHKAADLARLGNDKAACYHMARHYETNGNVDAAVGFFIKANAYSNAVRLCKEYNMKEELWNIGMVASRREKLECAKYFEDTDQPDKAVLLYHRAGLLHKSLDLAFKTQQFDALQQMTSDLDANSDPALVQKCAEYFISNQQFDKAVDLLAVAQKYTEALDVCLTHNIQLTEQLAERLTPEKDQVDEQTRIEVLEKVGECLFLQGDYHLATKKFTQAGDKIKAMKALLKSGDTDKIIFFAGVSRQREIYIMAANYLQSLDWQNDPEVLKNIITFYSKGKAMDLLANFYVACAQVEIDEFQNYEKALGAMNEASRCLNKVTTPKDATQHRRAIEIVQNRMTNIKRFVDIRRLFERGDHSGGMTQCRNLLLSGGEELEQSVRRGDIYALMIQHTIKVGDFTEARKLVTELQLILNKSGNASLSYYLSKEVIDVLAQALGIPVSALVPPATKTEFVEEEENEIQEEVDD